MRLLAGVGGNMGHKYSVDNYEKNIDSPEPYDYIYESRYYGDSLIKAVFIIIKLKMQGSYCVRFEWR